MIQYRSDIQVFRRLLLHSEESLFPRMKKRDSFLENSITNNKENLAFVAERDLSNQVRNHIKLLCNYVSYLETHIDELEKLSNTDHMEKEIKKYVNFLEKELIHDYRRKYNITE